MACPWLPWPSIFRKNRQINVREWMNDEEETQAATDETWEIYVLKVAET